MLGSNLLLRIQFYPDCDVFLTSVGEFIFWGDAMSKELRAELTKVAKEFKFEAEQVKKKAKALYEVALKAMDKIDKLQAALDAYKAPTLYEKSESQTIPQRTYLSRPERIAAFLRDEPDSEAFKQFLKWNRLTLEQAKDLVYKAKQLK